MTLSRHLHRCVVAAMALGLALLASPLALAQSRLSVIRDAEIETLLKDYTGPIFRAANVDAGAVRIILVGDRSYNAFVSSGRKVFVNMGVLMESQTPNEVIGVLAHETGHIAGGHLARLRQEMETAQIVAAVGMLAGAGAVVGSAGSRNVGMTSAGALGTVTAGPELARRVLLSYQRSEEQAADQAAVNYLNATGQSARGLLATFQRFANESMFRREGTDPYLLSHPLPPERIASLETIARRSPHFEKRDSPALQRRHDLARAKLFGFLGRSDEVQRRYPPSDTSLPARYARAIIAHRFQKGPGAIAQIDALIREQPNNPYFHELKGQALLEAGQARAAVAPLRRAVALAPQQPTIRGMLGHALVATEDRAMVDEAIRELSNVTQRDPENAEAFNHLARAHALKGNDGQAALASAQAYFVGGQYPEARQLARRAQAALPQSSPGWLRADDIANYTPPRR
jgi:predicted Zn-dependent protease